MIDLSVYGGLAVWGEHMKQQHADLNHFLRGEESDLQDFVKNKRNASEWLLFMEYVPVQYSDQSGTASVDYVQPMLIVTNYKQKKEQQDQALDKAQEIFQDIFLRARRELFLDGHKISIDNLKVDPVVDSRYGVGASCDIDLGTFISLDINPNKWLDNYTGY